MIRPVTLSVDAMGGDRGPGIVVAGINRLISGRGDLRFVLFGRAAELAPFLRRYPRVAEFAEVRDTEAVVSNDEKPSVALRTARNSSMRRAIDAVAAGECDGAISAGNTGALMAMAKFVLKTLPGVDRPAIATVFPTRRGRSVILDVGANVESDAENLVQFAVMGEVFARKVLRVAEPSLGLLNVGEEALKGHDAVKRAAVILENSRLSIRFKGFVEGNDIPAGTVDVVVTDGFTGNIALKVAEGTARLTSHFLKRALASSPLARAGAFLARGALRDLRARVDPRQYDGAMMLGLKGVCVKSHGGTDSVGFANALGVAVHLITDRVNEEIKKDFKCLYSHPEPGAQSAMG